MAAHTDILEHRESLGRPLAGSVLFHALVFGGLAFYTWMESGGRELFGSPNPGGGGVTTITPVSRINLPSLGGIENPVANPTESRVPMPPPEAKAKQKARQEEPDAIPMKGKKSRRTLADVAASSQRYRPKDADRPNQLYSSTGQAMSSPMFGSSSGAGVGVGPGGSMGTRFGWYEQLLRDKVQRAWQPPHDPRQHAASPAIVTFEITRDGAARDVRILQRSGYYDFDMSAQRAIVEAAPFQPLPPGYDRNSARIEFWFEMKK